MQSIEIQFCFVDICQGEGTEAVHSADHSAHARQAGDKNPSVVRAAVGKGHIPDNLSDLAVVTAGSEGQSQKQNPDFLSFMTTTTKNHLKLANNSAVSQLADETTTKQIFQRNFNYTSLQGKFCTGIELHCSRAEMSLTLL